MASGSSLPGPALNAARAALNSALNEKDAESLSPSPEPASSLETVFLTTNTSGPNGATPVDDEAEEGEIQELDLAAHAEDIRTVFSDPTNFNVKVRPAFWPVSSHGIPIRTLRNASTLSTLRGPCGSILPPRKGGIFPRHRLSRRPPHRSRRRHH